MNAAKDRVIAVLIIALVLGGIYSWSIRADLGAERREAATQREDAEATITALHSDHDRVLRACRQAIMEADEIIDASWSQTQKLYSKAHGWVDSAYALGVRGDEEELAKGLQRTIHEESQLQQVVDSLSAGPYGWSSQPKLTEETVARQCLDG